MRVDPEFLSTENKRVLGQWEKNEKIVVESSTIFTAVLEIVLINKIGCSFCSRIIPLF